MSRQPLRSIPPLAVAIATFVAAPPGRTQDVGPTKRPVAGTDQELVVHDVAPLLQALRSGDDGKPTGPDLALRAFGVEAELGAAADPFDGHVAALAATIRAFVEPKLRAADDVRAVGLHHLVALGNARQQAWITRFLLEQNALGAYTIDAVARVYTVDNAVVAELGLDGASSVVPDADAVAKLRKQLVDGKAEVLTAPRLTTLPGQRANLATISQTAYVKDFDVEVGANGALIANPVIDVVEDGFRLDVRAIDLGGDRGIGAHCTFSLSTAPKPFPEMDLTLTAFRAKPAAKNQGLAAQIGKLFGGDALNEAADQPLGVPMTIQLPKVTATETGGNHTVPSGGAIAFKAPHGPGHHLVTIVQFARKPL